MPVVDNLKLLLTQSREAREGLQLEDFNFGSSSYCFLLLLWGRITLILGEES